MKKTIDIDTLLAKDVLEITLKGKVYLLKDIRISTFLAVSSEGSEKTIISQLSQILNVDEEELKDVGLRASTIILNEVRKWVTDVDVDIDEDANPKASEVKKAKNP